MADVRDEFSLTTVAALGDELRRAWPDFPYEAWTTTAGEGLDDLRLLDRVAQLASCLATCLPAEFPASAAVLDAALASETFDGWMTMPVGRFVADTGIEHPTIALPLLARLTPRFSSEFAIRPFIEAHPEETFRHLHRWIDDPDDHVRRLVSEGTRPRLPWAPILRRFAEDPSPTVELLDRLHADSSPYVRRSVANHLNDISKDHPALAVAVARRWLEGGPHRWVVNHGLRTLVKRGDPSALALLGFDVGAPVSVRSLTVEPTMVRIGDEVELTVTLEADRHALVAIDYVVHYQGAKGLKAGKVFKLTTRTLEPGRPQTLTRRHRFDHVSIRRIHPGAHRIEIQVNGIVVDGCDLSVRSS